MSVKYVGKDLYKSSAFSRHSYSGQKKSLRSCPLCPEAWMGWGKANCRGGAGLGWGGARFRKPRQGSLFQLGAFGCSHQSQALQGLETWLSLGFSLPNLPFLLLDLLGAVQIGILGFRSKLLPPRTPLSWRSLLSVFFSCLVTLRSTYPLGAMDIEPTPTVLSGAHKKFLTSF